MDADDEKTQMRYAAALAEWADAGGYDVEVTWDVCCTAALGPPYDRAKHREPPPSPAASRTAGPGVPAPRARRGAAPRRAGQLPRRAGQDLARGRINESPKTILFISHDRELMDNAATRIVTVELGAAGNTVWTHPGGFATYHEARRARFERFEELRRRWDEEHAKLRAQMLMYKQKAAYNSDMASRYRPLRPGFGSSRAGRRRRGPVSSRSDAAHGRPHRQGRSCLSSWS